MLRVLAVVVLVVFASVMYAAPLPDDPALAKPVTLAVKGEALSDVLKMLQEQTGIRLRVDRDIADQKATILVDKKPLKEVMDGLSTVFGYRWSPETVSGSKTYRLWEDEKTRRDRENQRQKACIKAWEQVDAIFEYMTQFAQLKNDELEQLVDKLSAEYAEKHENETRLKLAAAKNLSTDPWSMAVVGFYQTLPESVMSTIKSGMTVHYDSASAEPEWKMPESVAGQLIEVAKTRSTIKQVDGKPVVVPLTGDEDDWTLARVNLGFSAIITNDAACLDAAVFIEQRPVVTTPASGQTPQTISTQRSVFSTVFSLAGERVSMATETSERRLPRKQDGALAAMKASFDIQDIVEETGLAVSSSGAPANRSDILAILHKKLGLQIISDHYSQWCGWTAEETRNVEEFLPMFGEMYRAQKRSPSDVDWGWDGDYCYLRSMDAAGCDLRETPNRLLGRWQAAYVKSGSLWLDELGQISLLPEEQISVLKTNARYLGLGYEVVTSKELRMYGMLSPGQRADAFSRGVRAADMTTEQRSLAAEMANLQNGRWAQPYGGPTVGIYDHGVRIDKPDQADNPNAPVEIAMALGGAPYMHHFKMKNDTGPGFVKMAQANTSEEAWQKVLAEMPAAKEKLDCFQQKRLSVIVKRAQGSVYESFVNIPICTPYSETANSGGAKAN